MKRLIVSLACAGLSCGAWAGVAGALVGGAVGGAMGKGMAKAAMRPNLQAELAREAATLNAQLPKMADSSTRIDSVSSGPDSVTYHYTLLQTTKRDMDQDYALQTFAPNLKRQVCQNLKTMIARGVTVVYAYRGSDGRHALTVATYPSDCTALAALKK